MQLLPAGIFARSWFILNLDYLLKFNLKNKSSKSVPGKTRKTDRNSCSHQLCECDREFAMCLQKYLPCPNSKAMCKSKQRLWQNLLMGFSSGNGVHKPEKVSLWMWCPPFLVVNMYNPINYYLLYFTGFWKIHSAQKYPRTSTPLQAPAIA